MWAFLPIALENVSMSKKKKIPCLSDSLVNLSDSLSGLFLVPTGVPPTSAEKEDPFPGKCKKLSPCKGR